MKKSEISSAFILLKLIFYRIIPMHAHTKENEDT